MKDTKEQDLGKLRKELMEVYSAYLKDPSDGAMKNRARKLHEEHGNTGPWMDKHLRHAINMLVDIGWDLPAPPKPTRKEVEGLIFLLASGKA
ncbi:MAG: hypothetical protein V1813_01605 [Candidatus Aenigmatarchaeota archaeon]